MRPQPLSCCLKFTRKSRLGRTLWDVVTREGKEQEGQNRIVIEHQIAEWSCTELFNMFHSQETRVDS